MAEAHEIGCGCVLAPIVAPLILGYLLVVVPLRAILAIPMGIALWLMDGENPFPALREFVIGEIDDFFDKS